MFVILWGSLCFRSAVVIIVFLGDLPACRARFACKFVA